ncbi:S1 family peptidase [Tsukamurella strandjordii]
MLVAAQVTMAPVASATPDNKWLSFPGGFAPGGAIGQVNNAHTSIKRCTIGFLAASADRKELYAATAGHCLQNTGYEDMVFYTDARAPLTAVPLGRYTAAQDKGTRYSSIEGFASITTDFALIKLDPRSSFHSSLIGGKYKVSEVLPVEKLREGMEICKFGSRTEETCGPITSISGDRVTANIHALEGDSGALGFVKKKDGTVAGVGLASTAGSDTVTFYHLSPPMNLMNLTLLSGGVR